MAVHWSPDPASPGKPERWTAVPHLKPNALLDVVALPDGRWKRRVLRYNDSAGQWIPVRPRSWEPDAIEPDRETAQRECEVAFAMVGGF